VLRDRPPTRAMLPSLYASLAGKASVHLRQLGGVGSAELLGGNRVSKPVPRTHFFGLAWGDVTTGTTRLSAGGVEL
jgi:hypothetical protein